MAGRAFSVNNFDLIRLFAALQVAILHTVEVFAWSWNDAWVIQILRLFPGVPLFFFISGYLISRSYEKSAALSNYTANRALRIFPALHVCVLFNLVLIGTTGYFATAGADWVKVALLYLGKTTFLQFYNPDFMRAFGDGVLNGSLWTITVELQFYLLTPILYMALVRKGRGLVSDGLLVGVSLLSLLANRALYNLMPDYGDTVIWKLIRVSFVPWVYMFIAGVLCQRHWEMLTRWSNARTAIALLVVYTVYAYGLHYHLGHATGNWAGPLLFFPLAITALLSSYAKPTFASRMLKRNDVSYGLYIYHMPVVNQLSHLGYGGPVAVLFALSASVLLALASWFFVERPLLRLKPVTVRSVDGTPSALKSQKIAGATAL